MKEKLGSWFLDIAKYILTGVILSTFLGGFSEKWLVYLSGGICVIVTFAVGLWFLKK